MSVTAFNRRRRELAAAQAARTRAKATPTPPPPPPTVDLPETLDAKVRDLLTEAGFGTLERVRLAADSHLLAVKGIGPKLLAEIRARTE